MFLQVYSFNLYIYLNYFFFYWPILECIILPQKQFLNSVSLQEKALYNNLKVVVILLIFLKSLILCYFIPEYFIWKSWDDVFVLAVLPIFNWNDLYLLSWTKNTKINFQSVGLLIFSLFVYPWTYAIYFILIFNLFQFIIFHIHMYCLRVSNYQNFILVDKKNNKFINELPFWKPIYIPYCYQILFLFRPDLTD